MSISEATYVDESHDSAFSQDRRTQKHCHSETQKIVCIHARCHLQQRTKTSSERVHEQRGLAYKEETAFLAFSLRETGARCSDYSSRDESNPRKQKGRVQWRWQRQCVVFPARLGFCHSSASASRSSEAVDLPAEEFCLLGHRKDFFLPLLFAGVLVRGVVEIAALP